MPDSDFIPPMPLSDQPPPFAHLARAPRLRTYLRGKLVFSDSEGVPNALTLDCAIRDMSEGGAKITLAKRQPLPPDLYLISITHRIAYQAKVMWTQFPARGLKFLNTYMLKSALPDELRFLQRLSADLDWRSGIDDLSW
jgi:PilZ domain